MILIHPSAPRCACAALRPGLPAGSRSAASVGHMFSSQTPLQQLHAATASEREGEWVGVSAQLCVYACRCSCASVSPRWLRGGGLEPRPAPGASLVKLPTGAAVLADLLMFVTATADIELRLNSHYCSTASSSKLLIFFSFFCSNTGSLLHGHVTGLSMSSLALSL